MSLILSGGMVATMDPQRRVFDPGLVVIEDSTIVEVAEQTSGRHYNGDPSDTLIDCRGKLVLPGLVNAHAHATEAMFRGCANDLPFLQWLFERNHPLMERLSDADAYAAALLCGLEMLSCGTTCYLDPEVWPEQFDAVARAMERVGLRACLGLAMEGGTGYTVDGGPQLAGAGPAADLARARAWHGAAGGRLRVWLGPRVLSAVDGALAALLRQAVVELGTGITVHFCEIPEDVEQIRQAYGVLPAAYLERAGLLGPSAVLVHAICLEPEDVAAIARTGTCIAHCPASNLKLGNGVAPIPDLLEHGVCVGLGTDGGMCNDSYDMLREMTLAGLIHKGHRHDPRLLTAEQVLAMATCDGARALGLEQQVGSLGAGKRADVAVFDMARPGWQPLHNPFANFVYGSAARDSVDSVIVDGNLLLREGRPLHLDPRAILEEAGERAAAIVRAAGLSAAVRSRWQPEGRP